MPAQIEWKAEDERQWGEFEPENGQSPKGWRPPRRLFLMVVAVLIAAGLVVAAIGQFDRFLDGSTDEAEQELLDGHALVLETAEAGDGDLLRELTFNRLPEWTDAQAALANRGLLLGRDPLGLHLVTGAGPVETQVEMDPGLRQAMITTILPYQIGLDGAGSDTIQLQQLFTYQNEDGRWLLNPPTGEFWGPRLSTSGRYLTLSYPERDGEISRRMAADLEVILGQACSSVEMMNCPDDLRLEVDFVTNPELMVDLADPSWQLKGGRNVQLPTPTVTGMPTDEAAYRALYRAYAQRVVARLITVQTELAQTEQPLLGLAISDLILQQLGLRARAQTAVDSGLEGDALAGQLEALWNSGESLEEQLQNDEARRASLVVDYLSRDWSEKPETMMLRLLAQSKSPQEWLQLLTSATSMASLRADLGERGEDATVAASQEWPDESVVFICDQGIVGNSNLYQYSPRRSVLSKVMDGREFSRMTTLPDGDGVLLTEHLITAGEIRTYLWQDGRLTPYEPDASADGTDAQMMAQAVGATPNQVAALSTDGRWQAQIKNGVLILSAADGEIYAEIEHGGRDCRGVAWVRTEAQDP